MIFRANSNFFELRFKVVAASGANVLVMKREILATAMPIIAWDLGEGGRPIAITLAPRPLAENEVAAVLSPNSIIVEGNEVFRDLDAWALDLARRCNLKAAQRHAA